MKLEEKYPYRYEMHCHEALCSACAHSSPEEMAQAYFQAGFAGMVFTDHFLRGNSAVDRSLPWEAKMRAYWDACQRAKDWAKGKDFDVIFGLEHAYGHGKEVLTYGIDLDFLLAHPDIDQLPLAEYAALVHQAGGFLSQAHPFRQRPYIDPDYPLQPQLLDAAEIFNFYNQGEENERALAFARENGLRFTSGGDEHHCDGLSIGQTGAAFPQPVRTEKELAQALFLGDYAVVVEGEPAPSK